MTTVERKAARFHIHGRRAFDLAMAEPSFRQAMSESTRRRWQQDPAWRARRSAEARAQMKAWYAAASPEERQRRLGHV